LFIYSSRVFYVFLPIFSFLPSLSFAGSLSLSSLFLVLVLRLLSSSSCFLFLRLAVRGQQVSVTRMSSLRAGYMALYSQQRQQYILFTTVSNPTPNSPTQPSTLSIPITEGKTDQLPLSLSSLS